MMCYGLSESKIRIRSVVMSVIPGHTQDGFFDWQCKSFKNLLTIPGFFQLKDDQNVCLVYLCPTLLVRRMGLKERHKNVRDLLYFGLF